MSTESPRLTFMLDEGVTIDVGRRLVESGHDVIFFSDVLPTKSPDQVVCATAMENNAILIAHDSDMEKLLLKKGENHQYRLLNLLRVRCKETKVVDRVMCALRLIVREWCDERYPRGRQIRAEIRADSIRLFR